MRLASPKTAKFQAMIPEVLVQLGFSDKEICVYLTLVRFGELPASTLARRAQMKRVTVYSVLDSLELRGLISSVPTPKGKHFLALDPVLLLNRLEEQLFQLKSLRRAVEGCIQAIRKLNLEKSSVEPSSF